MIRSFLVVLAIALCSGASDRTACSLWASSNCRQRPLASVDSITLCTFAKSGEAFSHRRSRRTRSSAAGAIFGLEDFLACLLMG